MQLVGIGLWFALAATASTPGAGPQLAGRSACRFAVPADLPAGVAEWLGPCANGKAEGLGVIRIGLPGGGAEMFYGIVRAGLPVEGMLGDSQAAGWRIATGFDKTLHLDADLPAELQQSPRYWKEAATAARVAEKHYAALGNRQSAAFYAAQAKLLDRGPGE